MARATEERLSAFGSLFRAAIATKELTLIRDCTHKGWALGSERFKVANEKVADRPVSSKGVGRPRVAEVGAGINRV